MLGLYDHIFRWIAPTALNIRTGYRAWLQALERSQHLPIDDLRNSQIHRLQKLCNYASEHVPLFRKLVGTTRFNTPAELPIFTKAELRKSLTSVTSDQLRFGRYGVTSGSSGNPFEFWVDRRSDGLRLASRYLFDEWIDIPFGNRCARIVANPSRFSRLVANELQIPHGSVNSKTARNVRERIWNFRPSSIVGQPFSLGLLSEAELESRRSAARHRVDCIVTTGETLLESRRVMLQDRHDAPVYNRYGLREISGYIAQECKARNGLHINVEHVMLEIVENGEPVVGSRAGKIVITDLHNYVMPLIRYDTGDVGSISTQPCSCGITWPLLQNVQGRESEYVVIRDNIRVPLSIFVDNFCCTFRRSVAELQFIQRRDESIIIRLVPGGQFSTSDLSKFTAYFREFLSNFEIDIVKELPLGKSGKNPLLIKES